MIQPNKDLHVHSVYYTQHIQTHILAHTYTHTHTHTHTHTYTHTHAHTHAILWNSFVKLMTPIAPMAMASTDSFDVCHQ